jgi:preprotein translocase subunit YajC
MDQLLQIVPFALMFGVMYFLIIRPQLKEKEAHDKLLASLVKDDRVVTSSGFHGTIVSVNQDDLTVQIAKNVLVTLDKSAVVRKLAADSK